jgi:hypothetical protein
MLGVQELNGTDLSLGEGVEIRFRDPLLMRDLDDWIPIP